MKIYCNKDELVEGIQTIQAALSARTTLPILMNFLMETENNKLKLVSTDLEVGVKHYVAARIESEGSVTVPAKKFSEMLHSLPDGKEISLNLDSHGKLSLRCGRSCFLIAGSPKNEYPILPNINQEKIFTVLAQPIIQMISKTLFSTSLNETQHVLSGVFWSAEKGKLEMVATDGRRLAISSCEALTQEQSFQAIIPHKVLSEFLRLAALHGLESDPLKKIRISVTENQIAFEFNQTTILSRLISGSFPNYKQVIPEKTSFFVLADSAEILAVTKRASLCISERGGAIRYSLSPKTLKVLASGPHFEYDDEIPVDYSGVGFEIAFNPLFMVEALKRVDTEQVRLGFTTPSHPIRIEPEKSGEYFFIIMPMRIESPV
jgi:DNA polymerase-3 subunit beta